MTRHHARSSHEVAAPTAHSTAIIFPVTLRALAPVWHLTAELRPRSWWHLPGVAQARDPNLESFDLTLCGLEVPQHDGAVSIPLRLAVLLGRCCVRCSNIAGILVIEGTESVPRTVDTVRLVPLEAAR